MNPPVKQNHDGNTATPASGVRRLIPRRGSVVADLRRLFERELDENAASTTYEPKHVASPTTINECNDHKTLPIANSPGKGPSMLGTLAVKAGSPAKSDSQEERDVVPDLVSLRSHVEHPEYLPRPLASPDRSSRRSDESNLAGESKKSGGIWKRGAEPRFKLQGGVFLHKTPSPLKNMVVTELETWCPESYEPSPDVASRSESGNMRSDRKAQKNSYLEHGEGAEPDLPESHLQPYIPLCHPCQDALLSSSTTHAAGDPTELRRSEGPSLPTSRSAPSHQSKVSNLRRRFDNSLPSSASMPLLWKRHPRTDTANDERPPAQEGKAAKATNLASRSNPDMPPSRSASSLKGPARQTSRLDGSVPTHSREASTRRGLKETIGLFESMSHQTNGEDRFRHIPRASSSPTFLKSVAAESGLASDWQPEKTEAKDRDPSPSSRPLPSAESETLRSNSRSPGRESIGSSQASDVKPLLYAKPSAAKASRHRRSFIKKPDLSRELYLGRTGGERRTLAPKAASGRATLCSAEASMWMAREEEDPTCNSKTG
ncbi:hypothetical protein Trco_004725 [Trichoderma cornu-damae]|uniref:Uncharacterized protein n=1 Tax=Trichoderma cornu-damae TaxID=654480 RepID=A0A9P8TV18_9HYPO|nr:hypothetical protein Trco_004725 [Trichoderma cornu-damae]